MLGLPDFQTAAGRNKMTKQIMGIVNATPDSFYDGDPQNNLDKLLAKCQSHLDDGADILDIGGESTRPGATPISAEEELARTLELIKQARKRWPQAVISQDTFKIPVALEGLKAGVNIINDVSGIVSGSMAQIIRESHAGWIIMHNGHGSPDDVRAFFEKSAQECSEYGIDRAQLCFDMGIGFNKDYDENMRLLDEANLDQLFPVGKPIYTKVRDDAPTRYAMDAKVKNCMVADGCVIEGEIENCVLFFTLASMA